MSVFYTKNQYQQIADIYCLGKITNITYLHQGYQSPKVAVTTLLGKFVIAKNKLSNKKDVISKSKISLQYEIDMLNSLFNLPVPEYLLSKNKKFIEQFEKDYVTVYKYIIGTSPKKFTEKMIYDLGMFLGEFHKQGKKFNKKLKVRRKFYDLNPRVIKKMMPLVNKQSNELLKSVVQKVKNGVEKNRPPINLPIGPIHVDISANNLLYQKNNLSGVIDFGNFYIGEYMIDIGKTIMFTCCQNGKLNKKFLNKFIQGYQKFRKLNKKEKDYLDKSILYAIYSHIWVDLYHVPLKYVPESYTIFLVKKFLPITKLINS